MNLKENHNTKKKFKKLNRLEQKKNKKQKTKKTKKAEQEVSEDLSVCVLNLQIVQGKSKSLNRSCNKKDFTLWKEAHYCM